MEPILHDHTVITKDYDLCFSLYTHREKMAVWIRGPMEDRDLIYNWFSGWKNNILILMVFPVRRAPSSHKCLSKKDLKDAYCAEKASVFLFKQIPFKRIEQH